MKKPNILKSLVWKHRPGAPGYYLTTDDLHEMVMAPDGDFIVREVTNPGKLVAGPYADPADFGISSDLLEEGEKMMVDDIVAGAKVGNKVTIRLAGDLAR